MFRLGMGIFIVFLGFFHAPVQACDTLFSGELSSRYLERAQLRPWSVIRSRKDQKEVTGVDLPGNILPHWGRQFGPVEGRSEIQDRIVVPSTRLEGNEGVSATYRAELKVVLSTPASSGGAEVIDFAGIKLKSSQWEATYDYKIVGERPVEFRAKVIHQLERQKGEDGKIEETLRIEIWSEQDLKDNKSPFFFVLRTPAKIDSFLENTQIYNETAKAPDSKLFIGERLREMAEKRDPREMDFFAVIMERFPGMSGILY